MHVCAVLCTKDFNGTEHKLTAYDSCESLMWTNPRNKTQRCVVCLFVCCFCVCFFFHHIAYATALNNGIFTCAWKLLNRYLSVLAWLIAVDSAIDAIAVTRKLVSMHLPHIYRERAHARNALTHTLTRTVHSARNSCLSFDVFHSFDQILCVRWTAFSLRINAKYVSSPSIKVSLPMKQHRHAFTIEVGVGWLVFVRSFVCMSHVNKHSTKPTFNYR